MAHLSVVIPVYKAESCLHELYRRLKVSLEEISDDFEIIMVEDCGGDRSWDIILELNRLDKRVRGIQFSRNFGQHYGITAGLARARGDWVVIMDCDLQDRPEEIPRLYAKALEGFDIVQARRGKRKHGVLKRFTSAIFYKIFSFLTNLKYDGQVGNFCIISRDVANNFLRMGEQLRFFGGLITWMGFPTASIEVQHDPSYDNKSSYTYRKLWRLAIETIIAYSDKPLRLSVKIGFLISSFAFLYGSYIVYRALANSGPIIGWSSLIVSLYFLSGIIIANLGIIGIYLGKTFDETKKRPLFIIRRTTSDECD